MFGVGKVARRRDDGVTEVLIASASVRAFFQPGAELTYLM